MAELIRTKCNMGQLVVTENAIRIETKLIGQKSRMISRATITGVDIMPYPKLLGMGGKHADLTFYAAGDAIEAKVVKIGDARKIVEMLGY